MGETAGQEHLLLRWPHHDGPAEGHLLPDSLPHPRHLRPLLRLRVSALGGGVGWGPPDTALLCWGGRRGPDGALCPSSHHHDGPTALAQWEGMGRSEASVHSDSRGRGVSTCPTAPELLAACGEAPQPLQVGSAQGTGPPPSPEPCLGGQPGCTHEK